MLITGFADHPLTPTADLLLDPAFWALHTCQVGAAGLNDLEAAYGIDIDDAEALADTLFDHDAWPVLTVPLHHGAVIHTIYRNLDGDAGLDYVVAHPDWHQDLHLAAIEGSFVGPGLSWPELTAVADNPPAAATGRPREAAERLLLLLPALGDADLPDTAVPALSAALRRLTPAPDPDRTADILLHEAGAFWQPPTWRHLADGTIACDGPHSRRDPASPMAFTADEARHITHAFQPPS